MTTIVTRTSGSSRRLAAFIIVGVLAFGVAAIATLGAETSDTAGGVLARMGDYIAAMTEALGSG